MNHAKPGTALAKGLLAAVVLLMMAVKVRAEQFTLTAKDGKATYGPFEFQDGAAVKVGDQVLVLRRIPSDAVQEEVKRKLLATKLDSLALEEAPLRDVVKFLRTKTKVNLILLTGDTPEAELPKVTLAVNDISLYDCLRYLAMGSNLTFRLDANAVIIELRK